MTDPPTIIELSVRVIDPDGTQPFHSTLTVTAGQANADEVAAAWLRMMEEALRVSRLNSSTGKHPWEATCDRLG